MTLKDKRDSFSIGSAASGVNITVYFDDFLSDEEVTTKIDKAIRYYNNALFASRRMK